MYRFVAIYMKHDEMGKYEKLSNYFQNCETVVAKMRLLEMALWIRAISRNLRLNKKKIEKKYLCIFANM